MATIIIVLAIILVLGSMMWVLPSPREKRQMQLRRKAMSLGVSVQLAKIDDPDYPGEQRRCSAYRLANRADRKPSIKGLVFRRDPAVSDGNWQLRKSTLAPRSGEADNLTVLLDRLPADCFAVEVVSPAVSVYWHEQGEESDVDTIFSVLQAIQEQ